MTDMSGYGILESYNNNLRSCNAWDRYRLGWKKNDAYPDIYAHDLDGNIVNGDIRYKVPSAAEIKAGMLQAPQEYVLHDFLTTGDAIRIQLPYLSQGGSAVDSQWIWLENHVKDTGMSYFATTDDQRPMGVRINLQIGNDGFNNFDSRPNYYVPFSRFGRWDFDITRVPINKSGGIGTNLPYFPTLDSIWIFNMSDNAWYKANTTSDKGNAFTGNSLLEYFKYDANGDDKLQDWEDVKITEFYKDNIRIGKDYSILGNAYDVFRVGDTLSLATNPATTPWLTHETVAGNDGCTSKKRRDNRKVYLNGLRIHIKEQRADGSVVVAVTQGYYNVNQDQRWCGDIVLNERINVGAGKKIHLDLGKTPIVKTKPIPLGNKRYFTEPTVLTCQANSVLFFDRNSKIEIDNLCALVLKKGCMVWKKSTSSIATIHVKAGGTLIVESDVAFKNGKIILQVDAGAYACVDGTVVGNFNIDNYGILNDVHPYLQQVKGFSCRSDKGAKSGYADDEPVSEPTPIYQSFFEGNPVYNQVGVNQTLCGYDIPIYRHGLEGDTVVDGLLYHKLSVIEGRHSYERCVQFWVRESEAHDKVWVRLPWDATGQEFLVVDMNLEKGDIFVMDRRNETVTLSDTIWDTVEEAIIIRYKDTVITKEICYVVDSVYHLEHPGGMLKHIRLNPQGYDGYTNALEDTWVYGTDCNWRSRHLEFIEGVGSNLGFVYQRLGASYQDSLWGCLSWRSLEAPTDFIVCVERDNIVYYVHPNAECVDCDDNVFAEWNGPDVPDYPPHPANERVASMSRYLSVSPNPAAATATLQWDAATDSRVSMAACNVMLYDMRGVRLRSFAVDRWPYTLSVSDLAPGAYLLRVTPSEAPADGAWQATVRLMVR
ncbi:MAG: T9SS type A sorting domain-containing protein [Bacteroidales bacterium]|nr:T9SS type A sorting domain-containing protein [Bacteroidales bacterium]